MKKVRTAGADNSQLVALHQRRYMHYNSFNRKDTIIKYIQISVAFFITLLVLSGLYGLSK
ncbi:hypothetical protein GR160_06070 [Flavobacterium sp. Sd200]|uniref:hypothetical protein n=1 Tax=Flavobacterium sp. Sd200 TaxID=2692211 RepID=UPI00136E3A9D|nr:hypothetical protein [Flavobacterium sp. Sd200]MXN90787.1 hypothetical protein [Flavobacterium sp. Sd200]